MKTRTELENELKLLESGVAAIREQLAAMPKLWEPEGGDFFIAPDGQIIGSGESSYNYRHFGSERKTREAAERAAIEMRKFNRLLAYRDEFAPGYEPDWCAQEEDKHYVFQDRSSGKYQVADNITCQTLGAVYMPFDVAHSLCHKLNSGEVVL